MIRTTLEPPTDTYINVLLNSRSTLNPSFGKHLFNTNKISIQFTLIQFQFNSIQFYLTDTKSVLLIKLLVPKICRNKFDCFTLEMFIIQELWAISPLNVQTDSIRAKLFTWDHTQMSIVLDPHSDIMYCHFYLDNDVSNIETPDNHNFISCIEAFQ